MIPRHGPARRFFQEEDLPLILLLISAALLWLPPAFSSFWRDEAITRWVIQDGWGDALRRALRFQPWCPPPISCC